VAGLELFADDADRRAFVELTRECERRHGWLCHIMTLLSTHYHVVVEATRVSLSAGAHNLNGRYARRFNKRHGRFGHVFAERFQARVIESDDYLYDVCAYVAQNPVKAGLCDRAEDWAWTFSRYDVAA
jgi:REP element-mobilizing transposase RayT